MIVVKKINNNVAVCRDGNQMYQSMREEYPEVADCVDKISSCYLNDWSAELTEEEKLYLIMHVNRVCSQETI